MKDLRPLHHFLGITVEHRLDGMFLHQCTYTLDIIKRAWLTVSRARLRSTSKRSSL
jgi:hypothetical protein